MSVVMRILAYVHANSGVSLHRLILPLLLMPDIDVFITNNLLVEQFEKEPDLFIYNRIMPEKHMPMIKELQQKHGFKIAVDIDDHWKLDPHHVLYSEYQKINFAAQQIKHLQDADVVLTTHSRLADEVKPYNPNVHVLPNAIPRKGQFLIQREPYYLTRLFWQGSDTHKADVEILARPADLLAPYSKEIKMVMAGYAEDHAEWHSMVMNYTAGLKHQYLLIPYAKVTEYYKAYANADICLVPLVNSRFNRMKSNLKILEAANLSLPVIASAVHPYLEFPGVKYARCSSDWVHWVKKFLKSKRAQKECGQEIAEHARLHFNFGKINKERKQILEYVTRGHRVS